MLRLQHVVPAENLLPCQLKVETYEQLLNVAERPMRKRHAVLLQGAERRNAHYDQLLPIYQVLFRKISNFFE